jgi:hypothetical protein
VLVAVEVIDIVMLPPMMNGPVPDAVLVVVLVTMKVGAKFEPS